MSLTDRMRTLGFRLTNVEPTFYRFEQIYYEEGRIFNAIVQYDRPLFGHGPVLSQMQVVTQVPIEPTRESVTAHAPKIVRDVLLRVLNDTPPVHEPQALELRNCARCRAEVSEFYLEEQEIVCRNCFQPTT